ncbi:MAG: PTS lactose/cellobiose transporter subunit IIA [Culicoidibacterales bacterium]
MTREESAMIGFEIVAYAGDARSKLVMALDAAEQKDFTTAQSLINDAGDLILEAHKTQTRMLQEEAKGEIVDIGFIMIHAQDHLMTTMLLRDVMKHLINIYKER